MRRVLPCTACVTQRMKRDVCKVMPCQPHVPQQRMRAGALHDGSPLVGDALCGEVFVRKEGHERGAAHGMAYGVAQQEGGEAARREAMHA